MKSRISFVLSSITTRNIGCSGVRPPYSFLSPINQECRPRQPFLRSAPFKTSSQSSHYSKDDFSVIDDQLWASYAMLFSSWTDGVAYNQHARSFLRYSLIMKILRDEIERLEDKLKSSVEFSPCCGPDMETLNNLELVDDMHKRGSVLLIEDIFVFQKNDSWSDCVLDHLSRDNNKMEIRVLYVPTAMYAFNPQSANTPGKQRQRARADGKKRRDEILGVVEELFDGSNVKVCCITLDLDDGSLKQPVGDFGAIPRDGKEACTDWNPNLMYFEGGNTFWLQHCIEKGNYASLIQNACARKGSVYLGKSAGAIVAGSSVSTATWKGWDDPAVVPGRGNYGDWVDCKGFGFVGSKSFFPHMNNDWNAVVRDRMESIHPSETVTLREEEVCCVLGKFERSYIVSQVDTSLHH